MKKTLFLITLLCVFISLISGPAWATEHSSIDAKLESQENSILEKLQEAEKNSVPEKIKETEKAKKTLAEVDSALITGSMAMRKFAVPFYMLFVIIDLVLLTTIASRSLTKRKKLLCLLVIVTIIFIVIKNLPLLILYFRANLTSGILTGETLYRSSFGLIAFLRDNSFAIYMLLISYGIINIILGENDIPRRLSGYHWIKYATILFIVFLTLPVATIFIL